MSRLDQMKRHIDRRTGAAQALATPTPPAVDSDVLREALAEVLNLARLKWGNLDLDANAVFERAEALSSPQVSAQDTRHG